MNNNWKKIWNEKKVSKLDDLSVFEIFKELKRADGFDVVVEDEEHYYKCFFNEWHSIYENAMLLSKDIESVYEVGCGSGVNLFMFSNKDIRKLGGIDYSSSLINDAKNIIDSDDVTCGNASSISTERKYDLVMSESVIQYFSDLDYAETVLRKMIEKSNKLVYLGEIHDAIYEKELMDERRRTIPDYDNKYNGLNKLYYPMDWFVRISKEYGKKVFFSKVDNPYYINSKYLYNCYIF